MKRKNNLAFLSLLLSGMLCTAQVPAAVYADEVTAGSVSSETVLEKEDEIASEELQQDMELIPADDGVLSAESEAASDESEENFADRSAEQIDLSDSAGSDGAEEVKDAENAADASEAVPEEQTDSAEEGVSEEENKDEDNVSDEPVQVITQGTEKIVTVKTDIEASGMKVAVWSQSKGQDDIVWTKLKQQEDGSWTAAVELRKILSAGICHAHVYSSDMVFVGAADFTVSEDEISGNRVSVDGTGSTRTASAVTDETNVSGAKVAVWSAVGGQDDIKWYKLSRQSDGSYTGSIQIRNLKHAGSCYAHFYTSDNRWIGGTTFTANEEDFPVNSVQVEKTDTSPVITAVTEVDAAKVSAAVWSTSGGQDDLVWYSMKKQADGSWTASINLKKIKHSGNCVVHVYADGNVFIGDAVAAFSEEELPKDTLAVTGTGSKRQATADLVDSSAAGVKVAVWSAVGGQDDIKWYTLKKSSNGIWKADLNLFALKHTGTCYAHFYTKNNTFLGGQTFTVSDSDIPAAEITVSGSGVTRTVKVLTGSHKSVTAAVWSAEKAQDDIHWYTLSKASDGSWKSSIPLSDLSHSGKVYVHCYADNNSVFLGDASFTVSSADFNSSRDAAAVQAKAVLNSIGRDLRAAFNWSAGLTYVSMEKRPTVSSSWYADYGFTNKQGNCYVMAATFYYMAKELGYDAHQIWGYVPSRSGPLTIHSWVEIEINGTTYMFDPQFTNQTGKNGYWFTYGTSGTWRYTSGTRMN